MWGQYVVNIDGTECRLVACPDVPIDPDDKFLAYTYQRSLKETTIKNMYSRWLNATGPVLKSKKFDLVDVPCHVYTFSFITPGEHHHNGAVALSARALNLVKTALTDLDVVLDFYQTYILAEQSQEPVNFLLQAIVPDQGEVDLTWFTRDNVIDLVNKL